ncbi:MAG: Uncharacterized protein CEO12_697 [Parcubacteria group bacterium Gr01-1014_46]|nr:MAG: Uncharacterized protein CEO12_697 [Parcubacteria group bacterium Gr01-1014_46]
MTDRVIGYTMETFTLLVDETIEVEDAVRLGRFDWIDSKIDQQNFPRSSNAKVVKKEIALFHFDKNMFRDEVRAQMDKVAYMPGSFWDLLSLATQKPNLQKKFPIVSLGYSKECSAAYLTGSAEKRALCLDVFVSSYWSDLYRYIGVKK